MRHIRPPELKDWLDDPRRDKPMLLDAGHICQNLYLACEAIGCGTCAKVCPENAVSMKDAGGKKKPQTDYDYCKGCGLCATECPVKAITMDLEKK